MRQNAFRSEGYIDACIRQDVWATERQELGMPVPTLKSNLAKRFGMLSQRPRLALIVNPGWSRTTDPKRLADEM